MARIADKEIGRIKQEASLLHLAQSQGHMITQQGKDHVVSCPFHEEKTPSCIISPKTNLFNCFGCGAGGSVIDWVMKTEGLGFREAVARLAASDILSPSALEHPCSSQNKSAQAPTELTEAERQQHLHDVVNYYHETLKQSPEALEYLQSRGLNHPELINTFKLGYANKTLGRSLPTRKSKAGCELRDNLQAIGIFRESGHEHFNGSLVVPVIDDRCYIGGLSQHPASRDIGTSVCGIYGRKLLGNQLRKGTPQHLYLPGPHKGVWNEAGLQNQPEIILCESLIDAMTFWVNGFRNVTSSYGTQGFTPDHLAALKNAGVERILIAYDRDEAGNNAAEKLAKALENDFACYRIELPKGMDVNEYALQVRPAKKSLGLVVRQAVYLGNGKPPERQLALEMEAVPAVEETPASPKEKPVVKTPAVDAQLKNKEVYRPNASMHTRNTVRPEHIFTFGDRNYRVRGLDKNKSLESLKVNILASSEEALHVDTFDLYAAKVRQVFIKNVAIELSVEERIIKQDLGKVLLKLESLQSESLVEASSSEQETVLSLEDEGEALDLLKSPNLLDKILSDFSRCGVVGEEVNKLVGYLAASSRKLDKPLAVMIQSTSAAGKSSLMDAVLNLMPEAERVQYSAMTGQSLFYMGETNLKHKILAIAEEEGASNASYALKLLQSEGEITIASTGKDDDTGNLITKEYKVEGPVMLFLTTTAIDIDEELMNRCLVLTVNESREQTRLIHEAQRKRRTLDGLQAKLEKDALIKLHRNAQSLLKPLAVINPYADQLTFLDDKTRTRRDHEKYLTLIDSIALLHQYQRPIKTVMHHDKALEYIEVQLSDIETANKLAHEVLGRTLDELPAQTRKLLKLIQSMVDKACKQQQLEQKAFRFSRRDIREFTGWSDNQLKVHCIRLTELEYLLIHSGHRGKSLQYEFLYDNQYESQQSHLMGLIDCDDLKKDSYDETKLGLVKNKLVPSCSQVGTKLDKAKSLKPLNGGGYSESSLVHAENALGV